MKNLIIVLLILIVSSCQKQSKKNPFIGAWSNCRYDGRYAEFRITNNYTINLASEYEYITLIDSKIENNTLINRKGMNASLFYENDTLVLTFQSTNKIILKSKRNYTLELNRIEDNIGKIDSLNLENWKKEIFRKFIKRAEIRNCPDLRTEDEKIIYNLGPSIIEDEIETEIPIETVNSKNWLTKN